MNKRLKLLIFITSGVVVAMLLGILLLSVINNVSSVEVYNFKVCQTVSEEIGETDVNQTYTYYLSSIASDNKHEFMNNTDNGTRVIYYFDVADKSVADVSEEQVSINSTENGITVTRQVYRYFLNVYQVGQTTVDVYSGIPSDSGTVKGSTYIGKYKVKVLKELYRIDHVLSTESENKMPITVVQSTSGASAGVEFISSNPEIAKVVRVDGVYYIEFYKEGNAVITAYTNGNTRVNDRIIVNVYNNEPNALEFVDALGNKINSKTIYTDGKFYTINYTLLNGTFSSSDSSVNCNNIKILDYSRVPTLLSMSNESYKSVHNGSDFAEKAFDDDGVVLDKNNNCIYVKRTVNSETDEVFEDSVAYITLQTFTVDNEGNETPSGTYTVFVKIIRSKRIALELEVSSSPKFSDNKKVIYYNNDTYTPLNWEGVNTIYPNNLYLSLNGEVRTLYYKVWYVWNNGDRELAKIGDALSTSVGKFNFGGGSNQTEITEIVSGEDGTYYTLRLTDAFFNAIGTKKNQEFSAVNVSTGSGDNALTVSLKFKCIDLNDVSKNIGSNEDLKIYTLQDGYYTYNYWDNRFASLKAQTDRDGNIIGFVS